MIEFSNFHVLFGFSPMGKNTLHKKDEWVLNIAGFCILKSYSISSFPPKLFKYRTLFLYLSLPLESRTLFFFIHFFVKPIHHYIFLGFLLHLLFFFWRRKFSVQECSSDIYIYLCFFQIQNLYHYLVSIDSRKKGQLFPFF